MQYTDKLGNDNFIYLYASHGANPVAIEQTKKSFNQYLGNRSCRLIPLEDSSYFQNPHKIIRPAAIVFPGGRTDLMEWSLSKWGKEGIKLLVNDNKASYIGFCAGAYLANKSIYTTRNNEPIELPSIQMIENDILYGPAYKLNKSPDATTAKIVPIVRDYLSEPYYTFWNAGGYYSFSDPYDINTRPLAYYKDITDNHGIAVMAFCENTPIILSNIHPEFRFTKEELQNYFPHFTEEDQEKYLASIPQQENLFDDICHSAGIEKI